MDLTLTDITTRFRQERSRATPAHARAWTRVMIGWSGLCLKSNGEPETRTRAREVLLPPGRCIFRTGSERASGAWLVDRLVGLLVGVKRVTFGSRPRS